jgi:hypothetical protein
MPGYDRRLERVTDFFPMFRAEVEAMDKFFESMPKITVLQRREFEELFTQSLKHSEDADMCIIFDSYPG